MNKLHSILFLLFAGISHIFATTYYAAPNGSGDGKTYDTPCSLSKGINSLRQGGDTLYLLNGQYDLDKTTISYKNGAAGQYIVISGYPNEKVILDFRRTAYGTRGLQIAETCTYLHIKDLTLRYSGKNNLYNEGSNCLFENLDIYGSADTGCQMKKGGNNIIKNVDSHDNFDYELDKSGNLTQCDFGGNADGFADKQFTGNGNHYIGCRSWNNSDDGWDFFQRVSNSETIIEGCICYKNGPAYYDMRNHPRYQTDKAWFDQFKDGKTVTDADGNEVTVTLDKYPNMGNGNGFKLGGGSTIHNVLVHHCLSVANTVKGYDQNSDAGAVRLYNNTAYMNNSDYSFYNANGCSLDIQNCISFQPKGKNTFDSRIVQVSNNNSWSSGFSVSAADFLSLDTAEITSPRLVDGSLAEGLLLHLSEGSALIDAGNDVGLDYMGEAPDLGCYETAGTEPQPDNGHTVAYITTPGSEEDNAILNRLRQNDSLSIKVVNAGSASSDFSKYELLIISPKPNSSASAFTALKGYDRPMLVLKPFLFKSSVWNWGNAINTQDLSVVVSDTTHALFHNIIFGNKQTINLFETCTTNALTAIGDWTGNTSGIVSLGAPVSHPDYTTIADMPAGTTLNGTTLPQRLVMIGVSEYSTADLTETGLQIIENAVCYLLGISHPDDTTNLMQPAIVPQAMKILTDQGIVIIRDRKRYTILGSCM